METKFLVVGLAILGLAVLYAVIAIIRAISPKGMEKELTKMGTIVANAQKNILTNNEEILTYNANKTANINKEAITTVSHAIKDGFAEGENIYCKHCGASIDEDSKFCKSCGKEQ